MDTILKKSIFFTKDHASEILMYFNDEDNRIYIVSNVLDTNSLKYLHTDRIESVESHDDLHADIIYTYLVDVLKHRNY